LSIALSKSRGLREKPVASEKNVHAEKVLID